MMMRVKNHQTPPTIRPERDLEKTRRGRRARKINFPFQAQQAGLKGCTGDISASFPFSSIIFTVTEPGTKPTIH